MYHERTKKRSSVLSLRNQRISALYWHLCNAYKLHCNEVMKACAEEFALSESSVYRIVYKNTDAEIDDYVSKKALFILENVFNLKAIKKGSK